MKIQISSSSYCFLSSLVCFVRHCVDTLCVTVNNAEVQLSMLGHVVMIMLKSTSFWTVTLLFSG